MVVWHMALSVMANRDGTFTRGNGVAFLERGWIGFKTVPTCQGSFTITGTTTSFWLHPHTSPSIGFRTLDFTFTHPMALGLLARRGLSPIHPRWGMAVKRFVRVGRFSFGKRTITLFSVQHHSDRSGTRGTAIQLLDLPPPLGMDSPPRGKVEMVIETGEWSIVDGFDLDLPLLPRQTNKVRRHSILHFRLYSLDGNRYKSKG